MSTDPASMRWTGTNLYEVGAFLRGDFPTMSVYGTTLYLHTADGMIAVPAGWRIERADGRYRATQETPDGA